MLNTGVVTGHLLAETNECATSASPGAVAVSSKVRLHMGFALEVRGFSIGQALSATPARDVIGHPCLREFLYCCAALVDMRVLEKKDLDLNDAGR